MFWLFFAFLFISQNYFAVFHFILIFYSRFLSIECVHLQTMPFISDVDLLTLSKKIKDIVFRGFPSIAAPEPQHLATQPEFKFYLCTKEHCIKFVDLFTSTSLMEVLQIDDEDVRQKLSTILNGNTDLIPNQYEGGFKVWEGLHDLIEYIGKNDVLDKMLNNLTVGQEEVNILDLGCGSGLLSIYIAAQLRTKYPSVKFRIYLQDYNDNVIKYFTIPNVIMNDILRPMIVAPEADEKDQMNRLVSSAKSTYHFMHGDWKQTEEELTSRGVKFDLIVSAETLYSELNYEKLYKVFHSVLRPPTGQVLIATKSHYFGVGGGTWSFTDYVQQQRDNQTKRIKLDHSNSNSNRTQLDSEVVHEIEANLLRHIILLKWT